ncbi:MAG: hypothetical protein M3253_08900 [Chloroflexota bacterium]|nr:hypothetical protein [Chloroflexota bacterium]
MHELPAPPQRPALRPPELATLASEEPSLGELFRFMSEAELRFSTMLMRIVDRLIGV